MSDSIHTSRAKFRKAFAYDYSTDEERTCVLGKIIDEIGLKRVTKANARIKKKSKKAGLKSSKAFIEDKSILSKKAMPSELARELVVRHDEKGYGRNDK